MNSINDALFQPGVSVIRKEHSQRGAANRVAAMAEKDNPLDKKAPKPWKPRRFKVRLFQDGTGNWYTVLAGGSPMQSTDTEVNLWQMYQEAKAG